MEYRRFKAFRNNNVFSRKGDFWCLTHLSTKIVYAGEEKFFDEVVYVFKIFFGVNSEATMFFFRLRPGEGFRIRGNVFRLWIISEIPSVLAFDWGLDTKDFIESTPLHSVG